MVELLANSRDPDQMLHSAAYDLGLHCLPVTRLGVSSLQWVIAAFWNNISSAELFSTPLIFIMHYHCATAHNFTTEQTKYS